MRPLDPRTVRSRESALTAARQLLIEQGLAGLTHGAVAARSGISRATLYRLWSEPADLVRAAVVWHIEQLQSQPAGDLRADLATELERIRAVLHEPATEQGMRVIIERAGVDPTFADIKDALYQSGTRVVRNVLSSGVERADLPTALDIDIAIDELLGPLFYRRLVANRSFDVEYIHHVVDGFLHGRATKPLTSEGNT